jgi:hypothetical protein
MIRILNLRSIERATDENEHLQRKVKILTGEVPGANDFGTKNMSKPATLVEVIVTSLNTAAVWTIFFPRPKQISRLNVHLAIRAGMNNPR